MTPTTCPRCKRGSEEWSIERDQERAGCPCGEVIEISFDDELPVRVDEAIPAASKKPAGWREEHRPDGWRGTLSASTRSKVIAPLLGFLGAAGSSAAMQCGHRGFAALTWSSLGIETLGIFAVLSYGLFLQLRTWTFTFEGGRFRADALGEHVDVALEDVLHFRSQTVVRTKDAARLAGSFWRSSFQLRVTCAGGSILRVPLFVSSAAEALFIAERASALLASGGHEVGGGYRGEQVRIAVDDEAVVAPEAELVEDDGELSEPRPAEKRTLGR